MEPREPLVLIYESRIPKMTEPGEIKFIADAMLGKLATWMRILGYDVDYFRYISDDELMMRAERENRVILTRDTYLIQRKRIRHKHFFIHGDRYPTQLKQVVKQYPLNPTLWLTRCLRCNRRLKPIEKAAVKPKVAEYVYATQERFEICPACGRIYWRATHPDRMREQVEAILSGD